MKLSVAEDTKPGHSLEIDQRYSVLDVGIRNLCAKYAKPHDNDHNGLNKSIDAPPCLDTKSGS